jgi:hypothetical protein
MARGSVAMIVAIVAMVALAVTPLGAEAGGVQRHGLSAALRRALETRTKIDDLLSRQDDLVSPSVV